MQTNKKYIFLALAIIGMTLLFAYMFGGGKKHVNWREDYVETNLGPFGTYLSLKLLEGYFPDHDVKILTDSIAILLEAEEEPANYVFIGGDMYMDSLSEVTLAKFVEKGNRAFIASKVPPKDLMQQVFEDYCGDFYWDSYSAVYDSTAYFNLQHPDLSMGDSILDIIYEEKFDTTYYSWHYFPYDLMCEDNEHIVPLGSLNEGFDNFIKVDYGAGSFYFHTTPILYTNSVLKILPEGLEYADRSFAHLQEGKVYWDKRSRIWHYDNGTDWWNQKKTFESEGPLQYILAQPSLAWAWYITLGLGLLYFLFRAKRQQRVIPVTEPNRNTSLEFISTIGRMYFVKGNHRKLALDKMRLFLAYVREHYKIQTKNLDEQFIQQLSEKAEVPKDLLKKIIDINQNIKVSSFLSEEMLIDFHNILDQFYKNCK